MVTTLKVWKGLSDILTWIHDKHMQMLLQFLQVRSGPFETGGAQPAGCGSWLSGCLAHQVPQWFLLRAVPTLSLLGTHVPFCWQKPMYVCMYWVSNILMGKCCIKC